MFRFERTRLSKGCRAILLSISLVLGAGALASHRYIWLYVSRKSDAKPPVGNLLLDPYASQNPEVLLTEANRLAWLFNWPKAGPLYGRAEDLFRTKGDTRNEVYARVGRIRAQSETMSWDEVSNVLGHELELAVAKADPCQMLRKSYSWQRILSAYKEMRGCRAQRS